MTTARLGERGYQRYAGPRLGRAHAVRSLYAHTLRHVLGLGRPARSKILPIMAIVFAFVPAVVFIGVVALFGSRGSFIVPSYSGYYGFIVSAVVLFVTFVAPEALCPDRRNRTLSIYLASPLTRYSYVAAKAAAVATVLSAVTIGPTLLLLLGLTFQGLGPDGPVEFARTLARIVAGGAVLTGIYTSISLGVSSLTDRRAVAAAATLLLLAGTNIVAVVVYELTEHDPALLISLVGMPFAVVHTLFGQQTLDAEVGDIPAVLVWAAAAAVAAVGTGVCLARYRSLQVTR